MKSLKLCMENLVLIVKKLILEVKCSYLRCFGHLEGMANEVTKRVYKSGVNALGRKGRFPVHGRAEYWKRGIKNERKGE